MKRYDVTSAGLSPAEDRAKRMRVYFISMSIRMACVASLLFVRGWWVLVVAAGAIILPYLAVIIANEPNNSRRKTDPITPLELSASQTSEVDNSTPTIIVDAPAERRSEAKSSGAANETEAESAA